MADRACAECGGPLPAPAGTGRPRIYCSVGCRRAAEHELRRLDAQIMRAEAKEQAARAELADTTTLWMDERQRPQAERRRAFWASEAERLRARLRDVLHLQDA